MLKNLWKVRIRYFDHDKDKGAKAPRDLRGNQRSLCPEKSRLRGQFSPDLC
nr:MAG TPA: hypothetical protein [Caudoviricetes sp.]